VYLKSVLNELPQFINCDDPLKTNTFPRLLVCHGGDPTAKQAPLVSPDTPPPAPPFAGLLAIFEKTSPAPSFMGK
jgi:hypothetical protein